MEIFKSIWLLEMESKINTITKQVGKINASTLEVYNLLKIASVIDNEIKNQKEKEYLKSKFQAYIDLTYDISMRYPTKVWLGLRERKLDYIEPIQYHLYYKYNYNGRYKYRVDYLTYAVIFTIILHLCSYYKLFYWDITASIIICVGFFLLGSIIDKKNRNKGMVL